MTLILSKNDTEQIINLLKAGKVGFMPTDTIYGLHCLVQNKQALKKIYKIKKRPKEMPVITLISKATELEMFNVVLGEFENTLIKQYWPGKNTLIFQDKTNIYQSFRLPINDFLISILECTGPLISTSANVHKMPHAKTVTEAIDSFGDSVDFYVDAGELNNSPSNIYKIENDKLIKIR